jgi:hypothetical protein
MDRESVDVIVIRLDDPIKQTVLDAEYDGQLRPAIHFQMSDLRIIDLVERTKMNDGRRRAMLLRRLEHDTGRRRIGHLGCFPKQRVQQIDRVEMAKPIDLEVAVDVIVGLSVLVRVDAGGKNELRHLSV